MDTTSGEDAAAAIRYHYDVSNAFYSLWLDESLNYSCALWAGEDDTLEAAQDRKVRYHLDAVDAEHATSILDVGCGWGDVLKRFADLPGPRYGVGLTLSEAQAAHLNALERPDIEVRTQSWMDYEPETCFDGVISVGAFEHFASDGNTSDEKIGIYRAFFERCHRWLKDDGALSLQTIAYANMRREDANTFIQQEIFPNADLPSLTEIAAASEGLFELRSLTNGRLDYARTCEEWARRLRSRRSEAVARVGEEVVRRYERYLKLSAIGFRMGKICLFRLVLRPFPDRRFG